MGLFDWLFIGMFCGFIALDKLYSARQFPAIAWWKFKGVTSFVLYFVLAGYSPLLWDRALGQFSIFDASSQPIWLSVPIGLCVLEAGIYFWHRMLHRFDFLWRWFHQMHHSAERIDIFGVFYFHPLDTLGWSLFGSISLVGIYGMQGEHAAIVNLIAAFLAMFSHSNIKTPRWIGYFIQRPEAHAVHHQQGVHQKNFAELPIFDILLGTFENPKEWNHQAGFYNGASSRILDVLFGRDISKPKNCLTKNSRQDDSAKASRTLP